MKITDNLNPFTKPALLLVTSRQDASGYLVNDREADKIFSFHKDKPEYTDKEGSFDRSGNDGRRQGGGETDINTEKIAYTEFLNEINEHLEKADLESVEEVILFAPEHLHAQTKNHLPSNIKSKITKVVAANVTHENLNELVARAQKE